MKYNCIHTELFSDHIWTRAVWIEGSEEIEGVVPSCWIMDKKVHWPPVLDAKKYVLECRQPSLKWRSFPLVKRKLESRKY